MKYPIPEQEGFCQADQYRDDNICICCSCCPESRDEQEIKAADQDEAYTPTYNNVVLLVVGDKE